MLRLRALSARSYTAIIIGWKGIKLHGYGAENAMKHRDAAWADRMRARRCLHRHCCAPCLPDARATVY